MNEVTTAALQERLEAGPVALFETRPATAGDFELVYRIKVSLENADGLFKPGMPSEAHLRAAEASQ